MGSLYSWSVLNKPIDKHIYDDATAERAVNSFYIAVGVFGTTTAIMGPWIERNGPRQGVLLGTTSFFVGNIIVAIGIHYKQIAVVYLGYGLFCGFGMGLCYISPVSALQKWFPDYRGTAAGFAVGGYGAGSVVWGKVYLPTIKAVGLANMFILLGGLIAGALYICAVILRNPPLDFVVSGLNIHGEAVNEAEGVMHRGEKLSIMSNHEFESITTPSAKDIDAVVQPTDDAHAQVKKLTLVQAIKTPDFLFMYLMFFANQLFGLIVLSKLSSMCVDIFGKTADQGADIVSANGVFNCCGRLVFPMITDVLIRWFKLDHAMARKCLYFYALASQVIIIALMPTLIENDNYTAFVVFVFILTASYGGGFGTIPAFLTDMFGAFNIGAMHGLILTAWSIGGVVGGISFTSVYKDMVKDGTSIPDAYVSNIHAILVVVCVCGIAVLFVRTDPRDRFAPGYQYTMCGKRVISIKPKRQPEEPLLSAA
jgi:MFS family permease